MSARPLDLAVVGGGPAGLATAIHAAAAGLRVRVLDAGAPGHDKACGEGLMPRAAARLDELGVRLDAGSALPFSGIRFVQDGAVAEARFAGRRGLAVRRPVLHRALADRAERLGAELAWRTRVRGIEGGAVVTDAGPVPARWIVGADGLHSRVRRWARLDAPPPAAGSRRFGVRRHLQATPWSDCVEVWWARGAEAFVTPLAGGMVGVNVTWDGAPSSFDALLGRIPALRDRLDGAARASADRGAGSYAQRALAVVRGRVLLVGDASGYGDSITGEGLGLAFADAASAVEAVLSADPSVHARAHARARLAVGATTALLVALARRPRLRGAAVRLLADHPRLFGAALALASGSTSPTSIPHVHAPRVQRRSCP